MEKRKAAVLYGPKDIRIEMIDMPKIGEHDVLVKARSVGICGSDLHYYKDFKMGKDVVTGPYILGHECAGDIMEVGSAVKTENLATGSQLNLAFRVFIVSIA